MSRRYAKFIFAEFIFVGAEIIVLVIAVFRYIIYAIITDVSSTPVPITTTEIPIQSEVVPIQSEVVEDEDYYDFSENIVFYVASSNPYILGRSYFGSNVVNENGVYYTPTQEELQWMYKMVYAESGNQDTLGQIYVANVIINRAIEYDLSLIDVSLQDRQFSCIRNGVPCVKRDGKWISVTEDMITDELKEAVNDAFEKDYTEEILREIAESRNLDEKYYEGGALYFYNPGEVSQDATDSRSGIQVKFEHGAHVFYRFWNK